MRSPSTQLLLEPFPLPDPAIARHPSVLLTPRELRPWLEDLPLGNPPRSAQMTLQQLRLLVRDPQPGPRLTTLLDGYTDTLERLRQIVDTRLPADADTALPLDQLELYVLEIVTEMANGYLRACNDQIVLGKAPPLSTLYSAAALLDDAALLASLHYHRPTQPEWQLLLHNYLLAEQLGLAKKPHDAKVPARDGSNTIHNVFFSALLLACSDPHQHRPVQIRAWHNWLLQNTATLSLVTLPQGNAAIPVDISGQLSALAAARNAKPGPNTRYVVADTLLAALRDDPEAPASLLETLTDLVRGRRAPEQRQAQRQARNHPYRLIFGLHNISQRLVSLAEDNGNTPVLATAARQVNQSRGGAAFEMPGPLQHELIIGEPLLAEADAQTGGSAAGAVGFLARIVRVVIDQSQQIELGVEKLPGRVMPVSLTGSAGERTRGDTVALLLHARETGSFTLIAPRRVYREGDLVAVEGPSVRHNLRMRGLTGGSRRMAFIDVEVATG